MNYFHNKTNRKFVIKKLSLFLFTILAFNWLFNNKILAENRKINNHLLEESYRLLDRGKNQESIRLFEKILTEYSNESSIFKGGVHEGLGRAYSQSGRYLQAIKEWESAKKIYKEYPQKAIQKKLVLLLFNLGQAYSSVGELENAISSFNEAQKLAKNLKLNREITIATGSLGQVYLSQGNYEKAIASFRQVLELAENQEDVVKTLNNLTLVYEQRAKRNGSLATEVKEEGNDRFFQALELQQELDLKLANSVARRAFQESLSLDNASTVRAWLNWRELEKSERTIEHRDKVFAILDRLPGDRTKIFLTINFASIDRSRALELLSLAENTAFSIQDRGALSYVLLEKGKIYRQQQDFKQAESLLKRGIIAGIATGEGHALYDLYRNLALTYKATGELTQTKKAYSSAIATLQEIRGDIALESFKGQLNFRAEIEPIFREYLEILLSDREIEAALDLFTQLRLFQLQALYGDNCSEIGPVDFSPYNFLAKTNSALITSIVLDEKTYTILQLPNKKTIVRAREVNGKSLIKEIEQWRADIELKLNYNYLSLSKKFYDLLIEPIEDELKAYKVENLVFVQDSFLRNISPAALYDRNEEKYLVEKYGLALSLGLSYNLEPKLKEKSIAAFGLTQSYQGLPALPYVANELKQIKKVTNAQIFPDREFSRSIFKTNLEKFRLSIVHLATHARFSGTLETAWILTSDGRVSITELESILDKTPLPIDLLVLSACATAVGNDRSVLGLAGVALRSGVGSTLGSFWYVQDRETAELMTDFYEFLKETDSNPVSALRKAQIKQLKKSDQHPGFWSAFSIIQ